MRTFKATKTSLFRGKLEIKKGTLFTTDITMTSDVFQTSNEKAGIVLTVEKGELVLNTIPAKKLVISSTPTKSIKKSVKKPVEKLEEDTPKEVEEE